jgi:hypothetical protein
VTCRKAAEGAIFVKKVKQSQKGKSSQANVSQASSNSPHDSPGNYDRKLEYSRGVLFNGLFQLALRDALMENDGLRILSHWRFLIPHFFQWGHTKYLIAANRLLMNVGGAVCERLIQQLTWSRTVNPTGTQGGNIEKDLQQEHFNKYYKGKDECKKRTKNSRALSLHNIAVICLTKPGQESSFK